MVAFLPIGLVHSPFTSREQTPIQSSRSRARGEVELLREYEDGLRDLDGFSHIILLYFFHQAEPGYSLTVTPFLDDVPKGVFATRFPRRPNPIGLSVVRLVRREGRVLDVKPYVPPFDAFPDATLGWLEERV
jgi:tRNA-Thr(GGU) m(6)t(6)A37 methyltransferase TsaA